MQRFSIMQPRQHGSKPQRVEGSRLPARYDGPMARVVTSRPKQYHPPSNDYGVQVEANAYWHAVERQPPSPVMQRQPVSHKQAGQPEMFSDAQAAAKANGSPSQHYAVAGVYGLDRQADGALTAVLGSGEVRFSCNPVLALNQLNLVGQSSETGHELAADFNAGLNQPVKRRSLWLMGVRC